MIFGGYAPMIVTWLIGFLGTPIAPAYYLTFGVVAGFSASLILIEAYRFHQLGKSRQVKAFDFTSSSEVGIAASLKIDAN